MPATKRAHSAVTSFTTGAEPVRICKVSLRTVPVCRGQSCPARADRRRGEKTGGVPKLALSVGVLLVVVGVVAYVVSGPGASPTALIPAALGVLLAVAGIAGLRGGDLRRHAMHGAAAVALVGTLGAAGQLIGRPARGSDDAEVALTAGILTLLLCGIFLVLAVRSFLEARRSRQRASN